MREKITINFIFSFTCHSSSFVVVIIHPAWIKHRESSTNFSHATTSTTVQCAWNFNVHTLGGEVWIPFFLFFCLFRARFTRSSCNCDHHDERGIRRVIHPRIIHLTLWSVKWKSTTISKLMAFTTADDVEDDDALLHLDILIWEKSIKTHSFILFAAAMSGTLKRLKSTRNTLFAVVNMRARSFEQCQQQLTSFKNVNQALSFSLTGRFWIISSYLFFSFNFSPLCLSFMMIIHPRVRRSWKKNQSRGGWSPPTLELRIHTCAAEKTSIKG